MDSKRIRLFVTIYPDGGLTTHFAEASCPDVKIPGATYASREHLMGKFIKIGLDPMDLLGHPGRKQFDLNLDLTAEQVEALGFNEVGALI